MAKPMEFDQETYKQQTNEAAEEGITASSDMNSKTGRGRHNQNMQIYN
jgi:hypothetical protein